MLDFSYQELVSRAKTIDVIWFNERKLLSSVFEVEHSTDIQNSLLKFNDLQDFYSQFYIVSSKKRNEEFLKKLNYSSFKEIKNRIKFIDYQFVSDLHTKMSELNTVGNL
jgi:adenosine deaminase